MAELRPSAELCNTFDMLATLGIGFERHDNRPGQ